MSKTAMKTHNQLQLTDIVNDIKLIVEGEDALADVKNGIYPSLVGYLHNQLPPSSIATSEDWNNIFHITLDALETDLKNLHGITSLPTAYRTAKSVIRRAIDAGVSLVDPTTGEVIGKSKVENQIKYNTLRNLPDRWLSDEDAKRMAVLPPQGYLPTDAQAVIECLSAVQNVLSSQGFDKLAMQIDVIKREYRGYKNGFVTHDG